MACFRALKARLGSKESKKAKELSAQGNALGIYAPARCALQGQKHLI